MASTSRHKFEDLCFCNTDAVAQQCAALPFETRKLPNPPLLPATIGGLKALVSLDTGQNGALNILNAAKSRLLSEGRLKPTNDQEAYDLAGVRPADGINIDLKFLEVEEGPSSAAKVIGVIEETELSLGYAFLKQCKTVWDFREKRLYLLAR